MTAYTIKSDKIFLRCLDMSAVEVYELDSLYIFPVKGKHWSQLGITIGPGNNYEALKIGDKDIGGDDLQSLIKDLFNSRLMVNREGLGFLTTSGVTAVVLEVEYFRLFDLFDWSKYQVDTFLNTKWARCNFMDGRPLDILGRKGNRDDNENKKKLSEKEKVLEVRKEKINKLKEELVTVERKKLEESNEKQNKIDKLQEELDEAERRKREELKEKDDEIDKLIEASEEVKRKKEEESKEWNFYQATYFHNFIYRNDYY